MTNNDVVRRVRYTFNLRDEKVVSIFRLAGQTVTSEQVKSWLLRDDDEHMVAMADIELASFLNGFIIEKRGKKDGQQPVAESELSKNQILLKLKIALQLQNEEIIELLAKAGFNIGKAELTAFFRKPDHKNYRHCKSQFLRNFLQALQDKYRVAKPSVNKNATKNKDYVKQTPAKPEAKTATPKTHYVNPKASTKQPTSNRRVLKLKPEDIYKNS